MVQIKPESSCGIVSIWALKAQHNVVEDIHGSSWKLICLDSMVKIKDCSHSQLYNRVSVTPFWWAFHWHLAVKKKAHTDQWWDLILAWVLGTATNSIFYFMGPCGKYDGRHWHRWTKGQFLTQKGTKHHPRLTVTFHWIHEQNMQVANLLLDPGYGLSAYYKKTKVLVFFQFSRFLY